MMNIMLSVASAGSIAVVDNQKITLDINTVDSAVFTQQGSDLIVSPASGGDVVRLENFFTVAAGGLPPLLSLADGSVLSAIEVTDLIENFDATAIEPAAGGSAGTGSGGGAGFAAFDGGSIGDGIATNDLLGATELEFETQSSEEFIAELVAEDTCEGETFVGEEFSYNECQYQSGNYDDTFVGTDCDDTFIGGFGNDNLTGGEGADEFVYQDDYGCCYYAADGHDTITDFNASEGDRINLDAVFDNLGIETADRASNVHVDGGNRLTVDGAHNFSIQIEGDTIGSFADSADLLAMGIDVGTADVS